MRSPYPCSCCGLRWCEVCHRTDCICDDNYTREDARDDHAITQWETARDLGEA